MAVDGGATAEISAFLRLHKLNLQFITNTHSHTDHTTGDKALKQASGGMAFTAFMSAEKKQFPLDGGTVRVFRTPGHSSDSVVFQAGNTLLTGDTLFNGTIGNCFSGDMHGFFLSLKALAAFPEETVIYAGHDYVAASMAFARHLEPENKDIDVYLSNYTPTHVRSTLLDELNVNPYLRYNSPAIVRLLESRGLQVATEYERWESLMSIA
ncbi:MAG: hydroxyacylglutathione hydrolase C-terminal domain-containing protein [Desulfobacterales bacterium]|jgi:hydroxyacylglutathione hydrolase|nr:hydroxyacylglutathione hydrolase C-terminal domain-containing protein [Desulfobacterales bacterium]